VAAERKMCVYDKGCVRNQPTRTWTLPGAWEVAGMGAAALELGRHQEDSRYSPGMRGRWGSELLQ
jgi:hypothetical protein